MAHISGTDFGTLGGGGSQKQVPGITFGAPRNPDNLLAKLPRLYHIIRFRARCPATHAGHFINHFLFNGMPRDAPTLSCIEDMDALCITTEGWQ